MTEEEAKMKWCPFVRAHWNGEGDWQGNRFFKEDGKTLDPVVACLGSGCAMWQWDDGHIGHCGLRTAR